MDERYWLLDYHTEDHHNDFLASVAQGEVVCIVDENDGGIIAYALGERNAERIAKALSQRS